jgi:hypothetical protein
MYMRAVERHIDLRQISFSRGSAVPVTCATAWVTSYWWAGSLAGRQATGVTYSTGRRDRGSWAGCTFHLCSSKTERSNCGESHLRALQRSQTSTHTTTPRRL